MSGKKIGLDDKYAKLYPKSSNKNTISINPMQDDLAKMGGIGAGAMRVAGSVMSKAITKGVKGPISKSIIGNPVTKQATKQGVVKRVLNNPVVKYGTAADVGYEIGKIDKDYKGGLKVKKANLGLLMANKKIAGAGLLGLGMLAKKKGMFSAGGMSKKEKKIKKVMGEYKKGELNIGKSKKKVKNRKQAIAIALASARKKKA